MKKQIFRSICIAVSVVFLSSIALITGVLYEYFSNNQMELLKAEIALAAKAVELIGEEYLTSVSEEDYRITWISSDGTVLFDNKASSSAMENHLEREEIKNAIKNGMGESSRYSTTLMERQLYCAKKLTDGSILRLSTTHLSWWALLLKMLQPIALVILISLVIALFLALRLSKRIVKPLNSLDLESPNPKKAYEELSPLFNRIAAQKKQLLLQESELNRRKEEFETATGNMSEGIILLNETGNVLSINSAASSILGISKYGIGKDLLLFNNTFEIRALLQDAKNGSHSEKTISINEKNYQLNASPIMTDGKVCGVALIIFDITEKEKAESARREFTANVSHELKTPLQNISGYAELLANGMVKGEDVLKFSERIFAESKRMITLIEDIIKLSHLDEGATELTFQAVDLFELAKATYANLSPVAKSKHIAFSLTGESAVIKGIPQLLSEIIYNLCDNALKYNYDGGSATVDIQSTNDTVILSVHDTGIGIPPEEQKRIFERFYRVDKSHSKEVGGTGLGLSIVKHAALLHKAEIQVTSRPKNGTEIKLCFPKEPMSVLH